MEKNFVFFEPVQLYRDRAAVASHYSAIFPWGAVTEAIFTVTVPTKRNKNV
jgi:hypothetical protein